MGRKDVLRWWPFLASLLVMAAATVGVKTDFYSKFDKRFYQDPGKKDFIRPGLHLNIEKVEVGESNKVTVTYTLSDDMGVGLDVEGIETAGAISRSYLLGVIPQGERHYESYINRVQTSPITGDSAEQPTAESNGQLEALGDGRYAYTYAALLPEDHDPDAVHSVGMYVRRDLSEFELGLPVDNAVFHFRPSGEEVTETRQFVATANCNNCHDPLALHGGQRRQVDLCVMCHSPNVVDPDTGNSVDMAEMTHKIHMGANLPSVRAGQPYQIIGFRQSVHDYSEVVFPQDVRNCETCHAQSGAGHDGWLEHPTRQTCGSCHDNVNFATGDGHANLPQISDNLCSNCHFPQGELEFDASILGAHTIPTHSTQLPGLNITILEVTQAAPGLSPTVDFTITDDSGNAIAPSSLPFFNLLISGPTTDYNFLLNERAVENSVATGTGYRYSFSGTLPEGASGSYAASAEAFRTVTLNPNTVLAFDQRETANNPVFYFAVDDGPVMARRTIVADAKCESCHNDLTFHGGIRGGTEYCVVCHQTGADDSPVRPEDQFPARTIDFKMMVHRIHMGQNLSEDYTLYGFRSSVANFNEVVYPGDLRNCDSCHVNESYNIPTPGVASTSDLNEFFSPMPPNSAACIGCHDSLDAAAHAFVNISPIGEACASCHAADAEFATARVHARIDE